MIRNYKHVLVQFMIYQVDLIFFRVWNIIEYKVASTLFFQVWDHIVSACCNVSCLFSFLLQKSLAIHFFSSPDPIFAPCILDPIFYGRKPTHVFKSRTVGADGLSNLLLDHPYISSAHFWASSDPPTDPTSA